MSPNLTRGGTVRREVGEETGHHVGLLFKMPDLDSSFGLVGYRAGITQLDHASGTAIAIADPTLDSLMLNAYNVYFKVGHYIGRTASLDAVHRPSPFNTEYRASNKL